MTEKQKELLRNLANTLFEIAEEANKDEKFNNELSKLNLQMSVDETAHECLAIIRRENLTSGKPFWKF